MAEPPVSQPQNAATRAPVKPRARRAGRAERVILVAVTVLSLAWSAWWLAELSRSPGASALVDRSLSQLEAAYERELARVATPEALAGRIAARLDEDPRDWVVIGALFDLAADRGVALPSTLIARRDHLDAQDNGWIATGAACVACAWDLRLCDLDAALACGVAVNLTVLGDLMALTREGGTYLSGGEVDEVDVAIAFVGLAATGLVVATGGTSLAVKGGAALIRVAHRTGRLAPELLTVFRRAFAQGVEWARLPTVRSADDLAALGRPAVLGPAVAVAQDLGRLNARLGTRQTLHLMRAIDTPAEAARMARAAEVMGPRTLGAVEMLGKSRVLRLTLRLADEVWAALAGLAAALASGVGLLAPLARRGAVGLFRLVLRLVLR